MFIGVPTLSVFDVFDFDPGTRARDGYPTKTIPGSKIDENF